MKVTISWQETTTCRAEVEVKDEEQAEALVRRMTGFGDVPPQVHDEREEIAYSIDDADWESV